jgi:hypothetical protein
MTLIEVLVAATILFSFLVVMTQAMSTAAIASQQAEKNISVSLTMPFIVDQIKSELKKEILSSNGKIKLNNITYEWIAKQHLRKVILQQPIEEQNIKRFTTLYKIDLTIRKNSLHKSFHYMEIINEK